MRQRQIKQDEGIENHRLEKSLLYWVFRECFWEGDSSEVTAEGKIGMWCNNFYSQGVFKARRQKVWWSWDMLEAHPGVQWATVNRPEWWEVSSLGREGTTHVLWAILRIVDLRLGGCWRIWGKQWRGLSCIILAAGLGMDCEVSGESTDANEEGFAVCIRDECDLD